MRKKRFRSNYGFYLTVILFFMTLLSSVYAGGDKEKSGASAEAGKKMEITIGVVDNGQIKWSKDLYILKKMSEATGVDINVIPIPSSGFVEKRNAMIASKTLPDLMFNSDPGVYALVAEYGPKGIFYPIDTLFDKMPNFMNLLKLYPNFDQFMKNPDGHIYGFPKLNDFNMYDWGWCIRRDLLTGEEMTADKINTLDDFYKALQILKKKTGSAPWVARAEKNAENRFLPALVPAFETGLRVYFNSQSNKYQFGPFDANYFTMIEFLNKGYKDGLIHPDIFTIGDDEFDTFLSNGTGTFFIDNMGKCMMLTALNDAVGVTADTIAKQEWPWPFQVILPPQINGKRYYGTVNSGMIDYSKLWTVSATTKNPEAVAKVVDWAYSPIGNQTLIWGEEGYTFKKNADGKPVYILTEEKGWPYLTKDAIHVYDLGLYHGGWNNFLWTERIFGLEWMESLSKRNTLIMGRKLYDINKVVPAQAPPIMLSKEAISRKKEIENPINTYCDENTIKFIVGTRPLNEWKNFLDELKKMGAEELVKIYNDAAKR